jgi:hypothetical protein
MGGLVLGSSSYVVVQVAGGGSIVVWVWGRAV